MTEYSRPLRSFVRREGRLTSAQARALEQLWPYYGLEPQGLVKLEEVFARPAPKVLDIGFGDGEALVEMAAADAQRDYLGVEVHRPGVGHCLQYAEQQQLSNLRIVVIDAFELLRYHLPEECLNAVHILFPDPWPKKRHHKRRLIKPAFLDLLATRMVNGGQLHLATDWADYAQWMLAVIESDGRFVNTADRGRFLQTPPPRPQTKFERRGMQRGHAVHDLIYKLAR